MNSAEIAKLAGVSRSTVSRVINGYSNVPPETKEKITRIIEEYGYTPNTAARSLAGKPGNIIGLFIVEQQVEDSNIIHASPFYSEFMAYITDKLQKRGYHLLISIVKKDKAMESVKTLYSQRLISGGIFMGDVVPDAVLEWISLNNHYALLINQRAGCPYERVFILNTENYRGAYQAVKVLIRHGHSRIAHITGALEKASVRERMNGYRDCLQDNGLAINDDWIIQANMHREESGYAGAKEIFSHSGELPTAIFCTNDLMAFGAVRALTELGYRVPRDVSVFGYDNVEMSKFITPALSTVETSVEKLTEIAACMLLECIQKKETTLPPVVMKEFEIVMRDSVTTAPR